MPRISSAALFTAACLAIASCSMFQETPQQRAQRMEPLLSAAGFRMVPADTPARLQSLQTLPPLKVLSQPKDGKFRYFYADPDYCHCLFVGNQETYQHYQNIKLQNQISERNQEAAEMNEDAVQQEQMDWMMWPDPYFY